MSGIRSKLTVKTPEFCTDLTYCSGVSIVGIGQANTAREQQQKKQRSKVIAKKIYQAIP